MPASAATAYPIQDQAYRVYFVIKNLATGNPLTGGLTGLSTSGNSQIMQDGGSWTNTSNSPTEVGTSGYGYLDLPASEMNYSAIFVRIAATNSGAIEWQQLMLTDGVSQVQSGLATASGLTAAEAALASDITATQTALASDISAVSGAAATAVWGQADFGDAVGRATTVLAQIAQIWRYLFNSQVVDKNAQTQTLMRDNSSATLVQGPITVNSTVTNKGKMS